MNSLDNFEREEAERLRRQEKVSDLASKISSNVSESENTQEFMEKSIDLMKTLARIAFKSKTPGERLEIAIKTAWAIADRQGKPVIAPLISFAYAVRHPEFAKMLFEDFMKPEEGQSPEDYEKELLNLEDQVALFGSTFAGIEGAPDA